MTGAPSCEARSALQGRRRLPKSGARALLQLLQRLAIAVIAFMVCTGVAFPRWGSARLVAAAFDAARETTSAEPSAEHPQRLRRLQDLAARPEVAIKTVESDGDEDGDDDDRQRDVADGAARSLRCVPVQGKPDRVLRGELPGDTSRFAVGARLPRGPPVSGT